MTHAGEVLASIRQYKRYGDMQVISPILVVVLMLLAPGILLARATEQQFNIAATISLALFMGGIFVLGFSWRRMDKIKRLSQRLEAEFSYATGLLPPDSSDWVAMKVIQRVVDDAMASAKGYRKREFDREDALLDEAGNDAASIALRIERVRKDHHQVEKAKELVASYVALFRLYRFNASEK